MNGPVPEYAPSLGPCWIWTAAKNPTGYGVLYMYSRQATGKPFSTHEYAHRFAYEIGKGPIPVGLELDHLCRVRECVNWNHLEPVTHQINALRGLTVVALNAAKTECAQGHPFDLFNTFNSPNGQRFCRTCQREAKLRWRARH